MTENDYLRRLMHFYRVQRHDYLNHFQVAMGYLQMGKGERALEYLRGATAEAVEAAPLSRVLPAELAVELMDLSGACFAAGIEFTHDIGDNLPEISWNAVFTKAMEQVRGLIPQASALALEVAAANNQGILVQINFKGLTKSQLGNCINEISQTGIDRYKELLDLRIAASEF